MKRSIVYIDGLNLFYRLLKDRKGRETAGYKWLDLQKLCHKLLPSNISLKKIRYFTSTISGKFDPQAPKRQQQYLKALETFPIIDIIKGRMQVKKGWNCAVRPNKVRPACGMASDFEMVKVFKFEEKQTDINIACELLKDAYKDEFDIAFMLTNDTDFVKLLKVAKGIFGKDVRILSPVRKIAKELSDVAVVQSVVKPCDIMECQFPNPVITKEGEEIYKPEGW